MAGATSCYLKMLDKLQEQIFAAFIDSLAFIDRRNDDNLSVSYRYYFCRCSTELFKLAPLSYTWSSTRILKDWKNDFLSPFLDVIGMLFLTFKARCWSSLPIERFSLTYYINGFKSRILSKQVSCMFEP